MRARVTQVCTSAIGLVMFGVVCLIAYQKHLFIHDVSSVIFSVSILNSSPHFALHHLSPQTRRPTLSERAALTGIRIHSSATPLEGKSGYLANSFPLTCCVAEAEVPIVGVAPPSGSTTPWTSPCLRGENFAKPQTCPNGYGHDPLTGHEPKTCIDVNSEHTPINVTAKRNSFNTEDNVTTTVAASENSDAFQ